MGRHSRRSDLASQTYPQRALGGSGTTIFVATLDLDQAALNAAGATATHDFPFDGPLPDNARVLGAELDLFSALTGPEGIGGTMSMFGGGDSVNTSMVGSGSVVSADEFPCAPGTRAGFSRAGQFPTVHIALTGGALLSQVTGGEIVARVMYAVISTPV